MSGETYGSLLESCRFGIRRAIEAHRFFVVPSLGQHPSGYIMGDATNKFDCDLLVVE